MSILENWDEVKEAQEIAAESAGSTERKYADYMDSLEAHMNQLSTTWSQFLMNMDLSGKATGVIDFIQNIVQVLDVLINKTPAATIAITALAAALIRLAAVNLTKMGSGIIDLANSIMSMGSKGGKSNIFSSLFGFLTNGAFTTGINNAQKGMQGLAKGGEAVAKAMSSGGKGFAQFGAAATAAMTSTATGAAGATTAVTTLGAAIATLAKSLGVIALIGTAIWGVTEILDAVIVTDEELAESIQTHEDNISNIESTIEQYNSTLDSNKERIEEINNLKGTSEWSSDLAQESENLERQNALLEQQITLQERKKELEAEQLLEEQQEQFDRDYGQETGGIVTEVDPTTGMTVDKYYEGKDYVIKQWEQETSAIRNYLSEVQAADKALQKAREAEAQGNKELQKQYEETADTHSKNADRFKESAIEQEQAMTDTIEYLQNYKQTLEDANEDTSYVDSLLEAAYAMQSMEGAGTTFGDLLNIDTSALDEATDAITQFVEEYKKLTDIEIKPDGFESMGDWLSSISSEDLPKVQEMLENTAHSSQNLQEILSRMSGEDAVQFLIEGYNNFHGIVKDCTASLSEFNEALNTDYDDQLTGYGQMLDYVLQTQESGVTNAKAYRVALEGIGLEAGASSEQIKQLYTAVSKYMRFDGEGGMQKNLEAFWDDMQALMAATPELGSINEATGEVVINSYKAMADAMGIPEQAFSALIRSSETFYDITQTTQQTGLQVLLSDIAAKAKEAGDALDGTIDSALRYGGIESVENVEFGVQYNFADTEFGQQAKQNIVNQINNLKSELETISQQSGLKLDIDIPADFSVESSDAEVSRVAAEVQGAKDSIQKLVDDAGNIDTSAFTNIGSEIQEAMPDDISVDGTSIEFKTEGAAEAYVTALQTEFEGIDVGSILSNAIAGGMSFESGSGSGAQAFGEAYGADFVAGIQSAISAQEISYTGALDTALEGVQGTIDGVSTNMDTLISKLQTADGTSLSGVTTQISGVDTAAGNAATSCSNLGSALSSLPSNKEVKLTFTTNYTGLPSIPGVNSANGRQIPTFASGGRVGQPLRQTHNVTSLVGEEGEELVIDKYGNKRIVGENGAELTQLKRGDTVIPANVTKMIKDGDIGQFASGRYGSSGAILATPSGWQTVNNFSSKYNTSSGVTSSSSSSSKGSSSSSSKSSSSSSSSKSSSSSSSDKPEDPAEDLIKELEHRLNMEYITEKQYAKELEQIWKTYYKDKSDFRDEDWKYEEELHDLRKQFIEEEIDALEYQNDILSRTAGTEQKQIKNLRRMQDLYHQQAEEYRANGFDDLSPEIRELSESWWSAYDEISDLQHQIFENVINDNDHEINILDAQLDRLEDFQDDFTLTTENLNNLLDKQLAEYVDLQEQKAIRYRNQLVAIETELARLMKQGYETNKELIQDLEEQAEDVKNNILDIGQSIKDMELSKVETQLNRQEEIRQGIIDYAETQIKMLEDEIELLEEENQKKKDAQELERLQEALDNAKKNRMKRVYHADTGY